MEMFEGLQPVILEWFADFGPLSLIGLSFTEAIIQPIPPDVLLLPQLLNAEGNIPTIVWLWLSCTLSSVLGSLVAWWIGRKWGRTLLDRYSKESHLIRLENLISRYGTLGVFIAAFSPIPYKVFGWVAGMGEMNRASFIVSGLWGRGLRFGLEAVLIGIYGQEVIDFLLGWGFFVVSFVSALLLIPLWYWWQSLAEPMPQTE